MADPFADFDALDPLSGGFRLKKRKNAKLPELTPDEEESLIGNVLGAGGSFLNWIGQTLDKPGRAVRGTLAGHPDELLNLLPFSDSLGITSPDTTVSGRDLLEQYGLLGANQEGFDLGDVAGFGTELALDPLSFVGVGALTQAGKAASKAGTLTRGLGKGISAGERALLELRLPFTENALAQIGTSPAVGDVVSGIGDAVKSSAPVRVGRAVLDPLTNGAVTKEGQAVQEAAYYAKKHGVAQGKLDAKIHERATEPVFQAFDDLYRAKFPDTPEPVATGFNVGDVVRASDKGNFGTVTGATPEGHVNVLFKNPQNGKTATVPLTPEQLKIEYARGTVEAGQFAQGMTRSIFDRIQRFAAETGGDYEQGVARIAPELGGLPPELQQQMAGLIEDANAVKNPLYESILSKGGKGGVLQDSENFSHFPRYTNQAAIESQGGRILKTATDSSKARDIPIKTIPADVVNEIIRDPHARGPAATEHLMDTYGAYLPTGDATPQAAADLADWVANHSGAFDSGELDLFTNPFSVDFQKYLVQGNQTDATLDEIHKLFKDNQSEAGIPLAQAYKVAGLDDQRAMDYFAKTFGLDPAAVKVDPKVAEAAAGVWKVYEEPEWAKAVGGAIDKFNRLFKASVTLPFPSFYSRNLVGGQYINLASGKMRTPGDLKDFAESFKTILGTDIKQETQLLDELEAYGVLGAKKVMGDVPILRRDEGVLPGNPLNMKDTRSLAADLVESKPSRFDHLPGVGKARRAVTGAEVTGSKVSEQVEWANRASMYHYLTRKRGYSPAAAADEVKRLHFDYSEATPAERLVLARLVPFWRFQKKVIPLTVQSLIERPGGPVAQTVRAANVAQQDAPYTPPHLQEGLSVYLGGDRFLAKAGLPIEDPLSRIVPGQTAFQTIGRTLEKNFASANPLLTGLYTLASGREAFSGRDVRDLYPYPSDDLLTNIALSHSPASRSISAIRQAGDERKSWPAFGFNFLTGGALTDVSGGLEKARIRDATKAVDLLSRESPNLGEFSQFYAPDGAELTPDDVKLLQLSRSLEQRRKAQRAQEARPVKTLAGQLGG